MNNIYTMKNILYFNNYLNESKKYYDFLQTVSFEELPFIYKKSLIIYMLEGDVVEWSLDNSIDEISKNDSLVNIAINDYMKIGRNKNKSFSYGEIPINILTKEISKRMGYNTFGEYHKWYNDNETNHGNSILPIILNIDNEELIEDGWHRFHYYYKIGLKKIPCVCFM